MVYKSSAGLGALTSFVGLLGFGLGVMRVVYSKTRQAEDVNGGDL